MKRFYLLTAFLLLVPSLTFAQVKTVYVPGAHPRVDIVSPETPASQLNAATPLTPAQVLAVHEPMAGLYRSATRVNHPAVSHCDRLIAAARAELRRNF